MQPAGDVTRFPFKAGGQNHPTARQRHACVPAPPSRHVCPRPWTSGAVRPQKSAKSVVATVLEIWLRGAHFTAGGHREGPGGQAAAQTKAGQPPRPAGSSGGGEHAARAFKVRGHFSGGAFANCPCVHTIMQLGRSQAGRFLARMPRTCSRRLISTARERGPSVPSYAHETRGRGA